MSPPATRSPKSGVTRTRTGCWTCRARRKKCDETRPTCLACRSLNIQCEGYGVRLKWAVRGRPCVTFRHARLRKPKSGSPTTVKSEPQSTPESSPISLADYASEKDQVLLQYLGREVFTGLSAFERDVLYDYADWGALRLFATPATETVPDPARFRESLIHCQHSKLMLLNSLTYQITFDPKHAQYADEYYGRSITAFRHALADPVAFEEDMTPFAGILLCSISMNRAMPFTMHMNGIASIFQHRFALQDPSDESRELAVLIGALDLPTHILGRQTKHLYMWQQHCTGQGGIEEITGIPCSLLDLFASPLDDDIEQRLLRWPGEPGEPVMCKTWEATQWAGLIRIRDIRMEHGLPTNGVENTTRSVVQHILTLMRDLRIRLDVNIFATTDMFFFPLVAIGSQPQYLSADNRMFIRDGIGALANSSTASYPYYEAVLQLLEIQWARGGTASIDTIAKEMGMELGLY